jgi:hypothetical protein
MALLDEEIGTVLVFIMTKISRRDHCTYIRIAAVGKNLAGMVIMA